MVNDISVLNEWWLVSMPIPMEPQRQAIGNLIDLKSHCVVSGMPFNRVALYASRAANTACGVLYLHTFHDPE